MDVQRKHFGDAHLDEERQLPSVGMPERMRGPRRLGGEESLEIQERLQVTPAGGIPLAHSRQVCASAFTNGTTETHRHGKYVAERDRTHLWSS